MYLLSYMPYRFQVTGIESAFDLMSSQVWEVWRNEYGLDRGRCKRLQQNIWQSDDDLSPGEGGGDSEED